MTTSTKVSIAVLILALIAGGTYYFLHRAPATIPGDVYPDTAAELPSGTDTSDDGLAKDAAAIDANIKAVGSDTASVDAGISAHQAP